MDALKIRYWFYLIYKLLPLNLSLIFFLYHLKIKKILYFAIFYLLSKKNTESRTWKMILRSIQWVFIRPLRPMITVWYLYKDYSDANKPAIWVK